jgi:RNA polymerase sigma factor (sigma-70 family)
LSKRKKQILEQTDAALRNIVEGGEETLKAIYKDYRNEFLLWAKWRYKIPEADAADIFQDAVIVFYKNVVSGKITQLESSIKTYLYGIGKKMLLKLVVNKTKTVLIENMNDPILKNIDWTIQNNSELSEAQELIRTVLKKLTQKCMKILRLFYYMRFSMESIKENMGYNSDDVARQMKKKCMRKLEAVVRKRLAEKI